MPFTDPENIPLTLLEETVQQCWDKGDAYATQYTARLNAALGELEIGDAPHIGPQGELESPLVTPPGVEIPASLDDAVVMYRQQYLEMMELLTAKFADFQTQYFPNEHGVYEAAEDWLKEAIENPEAGIPASVFDKIFEEQRSKVLSDANRATESVMATFAARRYHMPPGQAAGAVVEIQNKAQAEIGLASQNMAKLALEQMRFNIEKAMTLRSSAMSAALEYIKALSVAPGEASKVSNLQSSLIAAAADFYRADIAAAELSTKVSQFNTTVGMEVATKNQAADIQIISEKVKALMGDAQGIAQMATGLYNNLHTSLSGAVSNSSSLNHSYNYEG